MIRHNSLGLGESLSLLAATVTISGSFKKSLTAIQKTILQFQQHGFVVLSPQLGRPREEKDGFVFLDKDVGDPKTIERNHLDAIVNSDLLYIVNPKGYVGLSVAFEIGYALANGIPVFCLERPEDTILGEFVKIKHNVPEIKESLSISSVDFNVVTVRRLQDLVRDFTKQKGFESESLRDKILLLTEELGELSRVARASAGLKVSKRVLTSKARIAAELADILIYVSDIANITGVDLGEAFLDKMSENRKRQWR